MAKETITTPEGEKEGYENSNIPRITSNKLFDLLEFDQKRGNIVIIDWLKYHFNWRDKYYIDKNAKKSADIQWKKYKEMIDLKVLAKSKFDEIFNLILQKSWTDLRERNRNVNKIKVVNNEAHIDIRGNDWRKGILSIFYDPHIDYTKIQIWWNSDSNRDEFYALARESSWNFELDSNDGGRRFVDGKTVYNEILPVFSEYLQNKE